MARVLRRVQISSRLGLRTRITLAFGLGALLLSALLSATTFGLTRENLLNQRDRAAVQRALTNSVLVSERLQPGVEVRDALRTTPRPEGSTTLALVNSVWTGLATATFGEEQIDPTLLEIVSASTPARMRYEVDNRPVLVVGVPMQTDFAPDSLYFELTSLTDTEETLRGLAVVLLGASAVTTVLGLLFGYYAAGRTLRPLAEIGEAAEAIAGGHLETRIENVPDADLRAITESFNHMAVALEERIDRDARFASDVSHELRSPLMTLTASIEVLENSRDEMSERTQTAVDLISSDVVRFKQLVEDLLEISRFDVGAVRLDRNLVFAGELVEMGVPVVARRPVPVTVDDEVRNVVLSVDKRRFVQILANLFDNAQKYAGGVIGVQVSAGVAIDETPSVRITLEDEGPGVPDEEKLLIFGRFSRGGSAGNRGDDMSTGLGLALVHEHVALHGGRVWVEDRPEGRAGGSRFIVELPSIDPADLEHDGVDGQPLTSTPDSGVDPDDLLDAAEGEFA